MSDKYYLIDQSSYEYRGITITELDDEGLKNFIAELNSGKHGTGVHQPVIANSLEELKAAEGYRRAFMVIYGKGIPFHPVDVATEWALGL